VRAAIADLVKHQVLWVTKESVDAFGRQTGRTRRRNAYALNDRYARPRLLAARPRLRALSLWLVGRK
jgi:hypothetical protein